MPNQLMMEILLPKN